MKRIYRDTALFHRSVRLGKGRKPIVITKFRTMKRGSAKDFKKTFGDRVGPVASCGIKDARVTKLGRVLRKLQLDELPQIMNLVKGEVIPVGIRPLRKDIYRKLPRDIQKMYDEMGPGFVPVFYGIRPFPPTQEAEFNEYRNFYQVWKKNRKKAYLVYLKRVLANRIRGKGWPA